jgi:hypothetical protein
MKKNLTEFKPRMFVIKAYTRKEIQYIYGVPEKTFQRWLRPFLDQWGMRHKRYLTIEQVRKIIEEFGMPGELHIKTLLHGSIPHLTDIR